MGYRVEVWLGQDDGNDQVTDQRITVTRGTLDEALAAAKNAASTQAGRGADADEDEANDDALNRSRGVPAARYKVEA